MMMLLTWLHLLAAISWIGGMLFLSLVVVPVLRQPTVAPHRSLIFPSMARHFRVVAWGSLLILLSTGPVLAASREIDLTDPSDWPVIFSVKLGLVVGLIVLSAAHDFLVGPRVSRIVRTPEAERTSAEAQILRSAPLLARAGLVSALAIVYCAVWLARS